MKKYSYVFLFALALAIGGCDQSKSPEQATTESGTEAEAPVPVSQGEILATVNGTPITESAFNAYASKRKMQQGDESANSREAILGELISLELMRQESIKSGISNNPDVIALIEMEQRTLLAGAAIKAFMQNNPVSDAALKSLYDEKFGGANMEYNARHILVETKEQAEQVISLLDSGSDFAELAKEKSIGPTGASGGSLGWFSAAQMVKPFSEAAAKLEKGAYTKEPVQTQFGWHVIQLEDSRESTPPPFEDLKGRLKMVIVNNMLQEHINKTREAANIVINKAEEPAPAPAEPEPAPAAAEPEPAPGQ